jgi:hypothetical protein
LVSRWRCFTLRHRWHRLLFVFRRKWSYGSYTRRLLFSQILLHCFTKQTTSSSPPSFFPESFSSQILFHSISHILLILNFSIMFRSTVFLLLVLVCVEQASAFSVVGTSSSRRRSTTIALRASSEQDESSVVGSCSRRQLFGFVTSATLAAAVVVVATTAGPQPASAKYSDYARREKDWDTRVEKGEVKFSTRRELQAQLQEIAPMNNASSKIFCPNGPSAAVSPLMENKCGDRLAMPSVYGRTNDVMGNSIPGFEKGYAWSPGESSSSMSASLGGFPSYSKK